MCLIESIWQNKRKKSTEPYLMNLISKLRSQLENWRGPK